MKSDKWTTDDFCKRTKLGEKNDSFNWRMCSVFILVRFVVHRYFVKLSQNGFVNIVLNPLNHRMRRLRMICDCILWRIYIFSIFRTNNFNICRRKLYMHRSIECEFHRKHYIYIYDNGELMLLRALSVTQF